MKTTEVKVVEGFPPNWEKIRVHFPQAVNAPIVVTYGDTVYNPSGATLPDHLIAHEAVHIEQQASFPGGPDAYFEKYASDVKFRLEVEIEAYITQLRYIRATDRNHAARMLPVLSSHLASGVYGNIITQRDAQERLMNYLIP